MAKGLLGALPFLAPVAALATGGLALPGLVGAEAAGLGAGEAAGIGAGEAASAGLGAALPSTEALLSAGTTAGEAATSVATPLSAGALSGLSDAAISGLPDAVSGLGGGATSGVTAGADALAGAVPSATQAIGDALPGTAGALGTAADQPPLVSNIFTSTLAPNDPAGAVAPAQDLGQFPTGDQDFTGIQDQSFLDKATTALSGPLGKAGLAGGGLLASTLMNSGTPVGSGPLTAAAGTATTNAANFTGQANQNLGALNTGALPAGAQSAIDQASRSAKATIRSQYAGMGLGHSSSEAQALASVDQQAGVQKLNEAEKLTTLGLKEAGLAGSQQALASEDYLALMNARIKQDDRLSNALARFSGSLAGGAASGLATQQ